MWCGACLLSELVFFLDTLESSSSCRWLVGPMLLDFICVCLQVNFDMSIRFFAYRRGVVESCGTHVVGFHVCVFWSLFWQVSTSFFLCVFVGLFWHVYSSLCMCRPFWTRVFVSFHVCVCVCKSLLTHLSRRRVVVKSGGTHVVGFHVFISRSLLTCLNVSFLVCRSFWTCL